MALDLSAYFLGSSELSSVTKQNGMIQTVEDALNHMGSASYGSFQSGLIYDPTKIKQNAASSGQVLTWNGLIWAPATAAVSTLAVVGDSTLGGDAVFSFTSIASTFKHLYIVAYLRSNRVAVSDTVAIRFNNDSAANYDSENPYVFGTTPTYGTNEILGGTAASVGYCSGTNAGANLFSVIEILVPHYAGTANNKIAACTTGDKDNTTTGNIYGMAAAAAWRSNSAINRVDFLLTGGGTLFKTGSRVTVYGI